MELDIDNELREVEEYERKLAALNELRQKVGTEGISREIGLGLEDLCGGPIPGIDIRKLTANPSRASQVAVEAIDIKRFGLMVFGSVALLTLLIKMFNWLFTSSKGHPGGGGGGGGGSALERELDKKLAEAQERIDEIREDPDLAVQENMLSSGQFKRAPETVEVIMKLAVKSKKFTSAQLPIVYARAYEWCEYFNMTNAVRECDNRNPAYLALLHLILNYDSRIDMRLIAFMDDVPALDKETARQYRARKPGPMQTYKADLHYSETKLSRYISTPRMDDANALGEMIKDTVINIDKMLDLYDDMMDGKLNTDEKREMYDRSLKRMKEELFGENSKYRHAANRSTKDSLVVIQPTYTPMHNVQLSVDKLELMGVPIHSVRVEQLPYQAAMPSVWADVWKEYFETLQHASLTLTPPRRVNSENENFPNQLRQFATVYKFMFDNMDRITTAISNSESREVDNFYRSINKLAKGLESDAERIRKRVKNLQRKGDDIIYEIDPKVEDGNMLIPMEKFLNSAVHTGKSLVTFCKHVEIARDAAKTWLFKIDL